MLTRNQNANGLVNLHTTSLVGGSMQAIRQTRLWRGKGLFLALALFASPVMSGVCHAQDCDECDDDDDDQVAGVEWVQQDYQAPEQDLSSDDPYAYMIDQGGDVDYAAPVDDQDYIDAGSPDLGMNFEVQLADGRRYAFSDLQKAKSYAKSLRANPAWGKAQLVAKKGYLYSRSDGQSFVIGKFQKVKAYHQTINKTPGFAGSFGKTRPTLASKSVGQVSSGKSPSIAHNSTPSVSHTAPRTFVAPQTRVNPPVVHSTPSVRPSYTAPVARTPSYSAPTYRAPSYSAPSYRAPSYSAPSYRAPSSSSSSFRSFGRR